MLVGVVMARFFPDTLLLRMRLKLCRRDFFKDLTLDSGPSIASESLGCRVHLRESEEQPSIKLFNIYESNNNVDKDDKRSRVSHLSQDLCIYTNSKYVFQLF